MFEQERENISKIYEKHYMSVDAMRLINELQLLISVIERRPYLVDEMKLSCSIKGYLGEKDGMASHKYKFKGCKRKGLI